MKILARRKPKMTAGDVMKDDTSDEKVIKSAVPTLKFFKSLICRITLFKGSSMRKIILVVYAIIVVGLGITVIAFIAGA